MAKRHHEYRLTLEHLADANAENTPHESFTYTFTNHDNLFEILEKVQQNSGLDAQNAASLALGVKLLSNAQLAYRDNPLFVDFHGAFRDLIMKLKALNQHPQ
ncbi:DUF3861 domain-containing protein [Hymenobacter crusticola]|uniref:DUF3861 domain-containing protein n=1 Tax=Hymenobacter crusticola TaxID=1770526 RepID=A0A243WBU0_9BACT|nr:DUF3861 domain-containing protein [Hymenobacter crusticola]OUJ72887.1 hypothetical protein BXP70_16410 [Hymenobacter crusticola]